MISTDDAVTRSYLRSKMDKHVVLFSRLRKLGGPKGFGVLTRCAVPRFAFYLRVHPSHLTQPIAAEFDARVLAVLEAYAGAQLDDRARAIAHLPLKRGGLGVDCQAARAQTAFDVAAAGRGGPRAMNAVNAAAAIVAERTVDELPEDPAQRNVLDMARRAGASAWLFAPHVRLDAHEFAAGLRYRLGVTIGPATGICKGCGVSLPARALMYHAPGCVRLPGVNATYPHDRVKHALAKLCKEMMIDQEEEPRDLMVDVDGVQKRPDLRVWIGGHVAGDVVQWTSSVAIDVTAVNAAAPSLAHRSVMALVRERTAKKRKRYAALVEGATHPGGGAKRPEEFLVFHYFPCGSVSSSATGLLRRLVRAAEDDDLTYDHVLSCVSVAIIRGVARVLGNALDEG
jgi:hypothetical protein